MTELLIENGRVVGIRAVNHVDNKEMELHGPVILATGHSARDVYRYLNDQHIEIAAKGIAVGVRLEHPAELIDQIQYHSRNGRGKYLPAAEYSFAVASTRSACARAASSFRRQQVPSRSLSTACRRATAAHAGQTAAWSWRFIPRTSPG